MIDKIIEQETKHLSPIDVGEILALSPIVVRKLVQDGKLNPIGDSNGLKRFTREEVERFACENDITVLQTDDEIIRILAIDDDEIMTCLLIELLDSQKDKVKIESANNAEEAHSKIRTFKPHIILLDIIMPDFDGFDICNLLKLSPLTRSVRVIAITGASTEENIKIIKDSGAEACLSKPIDRNKLMEAIGLSS